MPKYTKGYVVLGNSIDHGFPTNAWTKNTALYIPGRAIIKYDEKSIDRIYFDPEDLNKAREKIGTDECLGEVKLPTTWVNAVIDSARTIQKKQGRDLVQRLNELMPYTPTTQEIPNND